MGIMVSPARYRWFSESTVIQRTGVDSISFTSVIYLREFLSLL